MGVQGAATRYALHPCVDPKTRKENQTMSDKPNIIATPSGMQAFLIAMPGANPRITSQEKSYDPAQPQFRIPRKVVKGGSYLCAPNYYLRYRPAARQPQMIDTGMSHIGLRCIVRGARGA
jgi:hypothetical protein